MIENWLRADDNHVAVVHCKGGKGRTGTIVVSLLFFRGECASVEEAERLFASMRSSKSKGVTQPSQRRYIQYFKTVLVRDSLINYQPIRLRSVTIAPLLSERPILLQVFNGVTDDAELLFSQLREPIPFGDSTSMVKYNIELDVRGDLYFKVFRRRDKDKFERAFHVVMHSYFISSPQYILERKDLDHLKSSDRRFSNDLTVTFQFSTPQTARLYPSEDALHDRMSKKYHETFPNSIAKRRESEYPLASPSSSSDAVRSRATVDVPPKEPKHAPTTVMEHPLISPHVKFMLDSPASFNAHSPSPVNNLVKPQTEHLRIPPTRAPTQVDRELEMTPPNEPPPLPPSKAPLLDLTQPLAELNPRPQSNELDTSSAFKAALEHAPTATPARTLGEFRKSRRDIQAIDKRKSGSGQQVEIGELSPRSTPDLFYSSGAAPIVVPRPKKSPTASPKGGWAVGTPTSAGSARTSKLTLRGATSPASGSTSDFPSPSLSASDIISPRKSVEETRERPQSKLISLSYDDLPDGLSDSSSTDSSDSEEYIDLQFVNISLDTPISRSQSEKIITRSSISSPNN